VYADVRRRFHSVSEYLLGRSENNVSKSSARSTGGTEMYAELCGSREPDRRIQVGVGNVRCVATLARSPGLEQILADGRTLQWSVDVIEYFEPFGTWMCSRGACVVEVQQKRLQTVWHRNGGAQQLGS
jgi:hypothetical protein